MPRILPPPPPPLTARAERAVHAELGQRLRGYREGCGYSLTDAARLLRVCRQSVWRHEHGVTAPSLPMLHRFALVYGVTVAALVDPDNARERAA
jgi:predicted transcriptional regulator